MRPCSFRYFFYALRHIYMYETNFDIVAFRFARETFVVFLLLSSR